MFFRSGFSLKPDIFRFGRTLCWMLRKSTIGKYRSRPPDGTEAASTTVTAKIQRAAIDRIPERMICEVPQTEKSVPIAREK